MSSLSWAGLEDDGGLFFFSLFSKRCQYWAAILSCLSKVLRWDSSISLYVLLSYLLYSKLTTARDSICKLRKTLKFKSVSQKLNLYLFDLSKYRIFFILKREATFLSCFFMFALIDFLSGNIFVAHLSEKPAQLLQQRRRQLFHEYFKAINAYDALLTGRQTDRETEDRQPADRPTNE